MTAHALLLAMGVSVAAAACLRPPEGPSGTVSLGSGAQSVPSPGPADDPPSPRVFHFSEQDPDPPAQHAAFFKSVHQKVTQHWYADEIYRKHNPVGPLFGPCDHHATELIVEIQAGGSLQRVDLLKSCGLDFLDHETIAAVRAAAPFDRPPRDLVDTHGFVRFGFNVVFESKPEPVGDRRTTPGGGSDPAPPPPR